MLLENERTQVANMCRQIVSEGLVKGTSGNISVRKGDLVAISPGSVDYEDLTAADVCVVDMEGNQVDGELHPSSELHMHLGAYGKEGVGAVVHSHSMYASILSVLVEELPAIHYMIATIGGPIPVVDYHVFGSRELALAVQKGLEGRDGVILGSHGALTVGPNLSVAFKKSVTLEWLCSMYYHARLMGEPRILTSEQLVEAKAHMTRRAYGGSTAGAAAK